jgi:hypothetical protein
MSRESRFTDAYLEMAGFYRPQAPGDGMGNVHLSRDEAKNAYRLASEARTFAHRFMEEDDSRTFNIGCSNYTTNKAFVWTIEAARCLAGGDDETATKLLQMALQEIASRS